MPFLRKSVHMRSQMIAVDRVTTLLSVAHHTANPGNHQSPIGSFSSSLGTTLFTDAHSSTKVMCLTTFEYPVAAPCFDIGDVRSLPVGHTHEDVDQSFSAAFGRLRHHEAVALQNLHSELRHN